MSEAKEKREAAFPQSGFHQWEAMPGMTLRDYFAAKAMQGLIASGKTDTNSMAVNWAYQFADAMLAERAR